MTAKENKNDGPLQNELRQTPQGTRRVGQLEVGCDFSGVWQFGVQHRDILSDSHSQEKILGAFRSRSRWRIHHAEEEMPHVSQPKTLAGHDLHADEF